MRAFWFLWIALPAEAQMLVAGAIMTYVVDAIRLFFPKVDGRWVHLLTGAVTALAAVVSAIATGANSPIVHTLNIFLGATVAAIGLNEIKRGPGRLGQKREEKAAREVLRRRLETRENRRDTVDRNEKTATVGNEAGNGVGNEVVP